MTESAFCAGYQTACDKDANELERLTARLEAAETAGSDMARKAMEALGEVERLKRVIGVLRKGYEPLLSGELPDGDIVDVSVSAALHIESVLSAAEKIVIKDK